MSTCKTGCGRSLEGAQWEEGLCGECMGVSNFYLELGREANEENPGSRAARPCRERFDAYVKKHNLRASWRSGLGLMRSGDRERLLEGRAWDSYVLHCSYGLGHERALRAATGLSKRGGQMHTHSGQEGNHTDGEITDQGSKMVLENDLMGSEAVSWEFAWRDL